ncbi:MAG: hypothetical protein IPP96_13160 [Chitinophagaceae bacterium]|nr:hypothetical protein [Chitinophagaceae bacterium]
MTKYTSGTDIDHVPVILAPKNTERNEVVFSHILSPNVDNYRTLKIPAFRYIRSLNEGLVVN